MSKYCDNIYAEVKYRIHGMVNNYTVILKVPKEYGCLDNLNFMTLFHKEYEIMFERLRRKYANYIRKSVGTKQKIDVDFIFIENNN